MKTGLNLFVGQLIATISLLTLISLGVFISFYQSNSSVLSNYDALMHEEREKNKLNQIDMFISIARQAEKGFYAEQKIEDARWVLTNLDKAIVTLQNLYVDETDSSDASSEQKDFILILQQISRNVIDYQQLFSQSLELWKTRGLTRESGISLKLRESAYQGLRSRLSLYHTQGLLKPIYELRWLEYEYYLYGGAYFDKMKLLIKDYLKKLNNAKLNPQLTDKINQQIIAYQHTLENKPGLNKSEPLNEKKAKHQRLEKIADDLLQILSQYTIDNYYLLYRTLLYYEMEYRELGHQQKHVQGVINTIESLRQAVVSSTINKDEKDKLLLTLKNYQLEFNNLVSVDQEISDLKQKIDTIFLKITPIIKSAMAYEAKIMSDIQLKSSQDNKKNTTINIITAVLMLLFVIAIIYWMVKRMGGKVKQIGQNLEQIVKGNLEITTIIPEQHKRDELDWISDHIDRVAKSLSASMLLLKERNKELEVVSNKLSKYLSPQIHQSIFSGDQMVNIQSKRKRLTIFFSDIVGFTHTTEMMESEELTNLLNDYLNEMSLIALKYGGTIDKFIGDAMMIFFGDPESKGDKEDCLACVSMAIAMRDRLNQLQQTWEQDKGITQPFKVRIGIATGYCTVGNFGSDQRMDYTIIGGNVNLASRLEHSAESDQILIAHETYALIKDKIDCVEKETIKVKGISQPVRTYQVNSLLSSHQSAPLQFQVKGNGYNLNIDSRLMDQQERKKLAENLSKVVQKLG